MNDQNFIFLMLVIFSGVAYLLFYYIFDQWKNPYRDVVEMTMAGITGTAITIFVSLFITGHCVCML